MKPSYAMNHVWSGVGRGELIVRFELGISGAILRAGYSIASRLRPHLAQHLAPSNPTDDDDAAPGFEFNQSTAFRRYPRDCVDLWTLAYSNKRVAATPADEFIFWKVTHLNKTALGRGLLARLQAHSKAQDASVATTDQLNCERGGASLQPRLHEFID